MDDAKEMTFEERAQWVVDAAWRGAYHCDGWRRRQPFGRGVVFSVRAGGDFASFDGDTLTRLLFAAHDACVRVEIGGANYQFIKVYLHPRESREGRVFSRHPSIRGAFKEWRKRVNALPPPSRA